MAHHLTDEDFRKIYEKHLSDIYWICYEGLFFHQQNAEDLVDDVFLVLWERIDEVKPDKYGAFLAEVARRKVLEKRRAYARRPPPTDVEEYAEILPDSEQDMLETILISKVEAEDLTEEVLSQLCPEDRELIRQIREEAIPRNELAKKLGVTPTSLYTRVSRLRNRVKNLIQDVLNRKL